MRRPTATATCLVLSGLLLLTGCGDDTGDGVVEDLPTAGDVTGDTSGSTPPTPSVDATTTG